MQTNCIGPFMLCQALRKNIIQSDHKAIVGITSELGELDDCLTGEKLSYRLSKGAFNNLIYTMASDFKKSSNPVISLGIKPGWVKTDMTGSHAPQEPKETVAHMIELIDRAIYARESGKIFHYNEIPLLI